jgi:D-psicose/D-tagatose/L-ribulose 3-epimerase
MKIGICTSLEKAPLAVEAGFDYVELSVSQMMSGRWDVTIPPWDTSEYEGLPIEACNLFFPSGVKLFSTDWREVFHVIVYLRQAKDLLTQIGVAVGVIGSGNQRRCPPDVTFPYEDDPLLYLCSDSRSPEEALARWLAATSGPPGTVFAPESLERSETNVGTDCASFSRLLKKHGVGYTADAYHLLKEWDADGREGGLSEPSKAFWEDQLPHAPLHLHLAQLEGRRFPQPNDPMLIGFFARLKELGYDARVSLECHGLGPEDYREAIANVRTYVA